MNKIRKHLPDFSICEVCTNKRFCDLCKNENFFHYKEGIIPEIDKIHLDGYEEGVQDQFMSTYERTHKFKCPVCGYPFARGIGLIHHLKDKHGMVINK